MDQVKEDICRIASTLYTDTRESVWPDPWFDLGKRALCPRPRRHIDHAKLVGVWGTPHPANSSRVARDLDLVLWNTNGVVLPCHSVFIPPSNLDPTRLNSCTGPTYWASGLEPENWTRTI